VRFSKRMQFPGGLPTSSGPTHRGELLQAVGDPTRRQRQSPASWSKPSKAGANQSRPAGKRQPNNGPPVR
jgi:hypothetical protein